MAGPFRAATGRRAASVLGALTVAGIAALASYSHMREVAIQYGQSELIADLLPISVDGLMVVATVALGDGRRHRWSAWLTFWIGVGASVTANVLAAEPSLVARCISAWPAVAFVLVVEVLTRGGRSRLRVAVAPPPARPDETSTSPVKQDGTATRTRREEHRPRSHPLFRNLGGFTRLPANWIGPLAIFGGARDPPAYT